MNINRVRAKRMIHSVKSLVKAVLRSVQQPWIGRHRLLRDLRALGVRSGGILLVHSSLSALGFVPGGAKTVIRTLLEAIGQNGTLVMPTHSWQAMEAGSRVFDANRTGSCVGTMTEVFRKLPGVVRSLHPTHSVAATGPLAQALIRGHEQCETPCGGGTPYEKLLDRDGQILFLGAGLSRNTAFHTMEALAQVPYLMRHEFDRFTIIDQNGHEQHINLRRHQPGIPRRFEAMEEVLLAQGSLRRGHVGPARSLLADGLSMRDFVLHKLRADPGYLLTSAQADHAKDPAERVRIRQTPHSDVLRST